MLRAKRDASRELITGSYTTVADLTEAEQSQSHDVEPRLRLTDPTHGTYATEVGLRRSFRCPNNDARHRAEGSVQI
jgi:hypothetical protein